MSVNVLVSDFLEAAKLAKPFTSTNTELGQLGGVYLQVETFGGKPHLTVSATDRYTAIRARVPLIEEAELEPVLVPVKDLLAMLGAMPASAVITLEPTEDTLNLVNLNTIYPVRTDRLVGTHKKLAGLFADADKSVAEHRERAMFNLDLVSHLPKKGLATITKGKSGMLLAYGYTEIRKTTIHWQAIFLPTNQNDRPTLTQDWL